MATYVVLANFTDQGIRNVKDSPKRADAFKEMAKTFGVTVKELVWTQGRYDIVTIIEAPDESAAMSLNLSLGALGNVRTETLRKETKGGWPLRQRPKYRARSRLWRLTKNFQRTLQLRASNEAQRQLAFDIQVTSQRAVPELTKSSANNLN